MALIVPIGGHFADTLRKKGILSTTTVRKLFNCGGTAPALIFYPFARLAGLHMQSNMMQASVWRRSSCCCLLSARLRFCPSSFSLSLLASAALPFLVRSTCASHYLLISSVSVTRMHHLWMHMRRLVDSETHLSVVFNST